MKKKNVWERIPVEFIHPAVSDYLGACLPHQKWSYFGLVRGTTKKSVCFTIGTM